MSESHYSLSAAETERLHRALLSGFSIPIIADIEGYTWEALFHYIKDIPLSDPIAEKRSKLLFDATAADGRGWSLKTLLWTNHNASSQFEFVIQRADIFTKAAALGFPDGLFIHSDPHDLGCALVRHWNQKLLGDAIAQRVTDPRFAILIKNRSRTEFLYIESGYEPLDEAAFEWRWSLATVGVGLQGWRDNKLRFKWYANQKQLFEVRELRANDYRFRLHWERMPLSAFIDREAA